MNIIKKITVISLLVQMLAAPFAARAELTFDPNFIISDDDFTNQGSMTLSGIQAFLEANGSFLSTFLTTDYFGFQKRASEIIFDAAQRYHISPKVLLTKLQKEQSLITTALPTQYALDWAMGYGVCDDCSVSDPALQKFKGFGNQVDRAAARNRVYIDEGYRFNFQPGVPRDVDGMTVVPSNRATANLYNYTPHIHGNTLFWRIWNRWFARTYPDGTLLRETGTPGVWLIENGMRRPILSRAALQSRFPNAAVIDVAKNDIERYEIGAPVKFPNYTLVQSPAGDIYLLVNNEKKKIASPDVFRAIGYNPAEVVEATDGELAWYRDGRTITMELLYPTGSLLQNSTSGGVYYVEDGIKYPIWSKEILVNRFGAKSTITRVAADLLEQFPTAQPLRMTEGTLMKEKTSDAIYVVSNGAKLRIANQQTFDQLKYKKESILAVSQKTLDAHPDGEVLDLLIPVQSNLATR